MRQAFHLGDAKRSAPLAASQHSGSAEPIGIVAFATYLPAQVQDAAFVAAESGIPEEVVRTKLGITAKRRASYEDQTSAMAVSAARTALARAEIAPAEIDLIL